MLQAALFETEEQEEQQTSNLRLEEVLWSYFAGFKQRDHLRQFVLQLLKVMLAITPRAFRTQRSQNVQKLSFYRIDVILRQPLHLHDHFHT